MEPSSPQLEIRLLGPIELWLDGREVAVGGPRQRALLALLALQPGHVHPADALIEELWGGEPPDGADSTLRSYVSRLRQSLGGTASIDRTDRGYVLRAPSDVVDTLRFERRVRDGGAALASGAARRARRDLAAALALWRGRPFGDLGVEGALGDAANRLEELRLLATEQRIEADLALGAGAELVDELEGLVQAHPFRERLWRHLMLALYRAGRQADALAAYHRARTALDDELGIEPGPELQELEAAILRQDVPEVVRTAAQSNIPAPLTSFIGRSSELHELRRLIGGNRLVTLTGVGGVGKTRLAIEVARTAAESFPDGVWFVDLAPLTDPDLVASTVAAALGVATTSGAAPVEGMLERLGDRELLLVLDNCEHVRDACAELVAAVLQGAPDVHVLATSRITLGIPGEIDDAVPPLALPARGADAGSDAMDLFLERARAARPSMLRDPSSLDTVARIVSDLDGLPLAIELAAARAKALTIADIAAGLDDRFRFLVSWRRLSAARHRTLAEAMAWSFDLLEPDAQRLLADVSVFAGTFDLEAVAAVSFAGDRDRALDLIQRLVDASLVTLDAAPGGGSRYRLLETVRQYAAERLEEGGRTDGVRRLHAGYFAALAAAVPTAGAEHARGLARLDLERDNLRAALDYTVTVGDRELQRRLTVSLWRYWQIRGLLSEGASRLEATLAHGPDVASDLYPNALVGAGNIAWAMGRYDAGNRHGRELLRISESSGAKRSAYVGNRLLAAIALRQRDFETSNVHSERAVDLIREIGAPIEIAMAEMNHAVLLMDWGRIDTAVELYEELLPRHRELGHGEGIGLTLLNLGEAAFLLGKDAEAAERFEGARQAFLELGFRAHVGHSLQGLGSVAARSGDATGAAELLGRGAAILAEVGASPDDFNPGMVADAIASATAALGEERYRAAFDAGWAAERRRGAG